MSTDGSDTSSQIRQFGLYRTIDAKTEEFLKLSKKRQIKQGCVCAAISTLITVAVVISIVLIYEYSLIHDSKPNEKRPNLLSSMNNSLETLPFEVKFNKEKLDPAIVQLLPLILKTLKQNIDLDKIVEDSSGLSPYEKKETEEISTKTPAGQNLLRSPSSRLYTLEYKTFPILYFRNPSRNIEHFTKIRKIRDYQRIMNYVDKMISHRVSIGTAIPMAKYIYGIYKTNNKEYTTPMMSVENLKSNKKNINTTSTQTVQSNCQCSEKLSNIFNKFIGRLKTLVPYLSGKRHNDSTLCNHNKQKTIENVYNKETTGNNFFSSHNLSTTTPKINNVYTSYTPQINIEHRLYNSENIFQSQDDTMHDLSKLIKPNEGIKLTDGNDYAYGRLGTKQYFNEISNRSNINAILLTPIVSTQVTPLSESETTVIDNGKPMSLSNTGSSELPVSMSTDYAYGRLGTKQYFDEISNRSNINAILLTPIVSTQVTPLSESETTVIDNGKPMSLSNTGSSELPVSMSTDYENDTNLNIIDYFKMLDAHSLELVNKKIIPNRNTIELSKDIHNENSIENTLDNASLAYKDNIIDLLNNNENVSNIINVEPSTSSTITTHPPTNFTDNKIHSTINTTIIDYKRTEKDLKNIKINPNLRSDDLTLEEEIERAPLDDSDTSIKNLENMITKLNNTYEYMNNNNNEASEYDWELVKIKEDKYTNSMIPQSRSSYLEIHRGYWKKEEHNGYDNKINHYNLLNL